jgi:hypothetical protein
MRVKVRTADLLVAVKKRRAELEKAHERDTATYDERLAKHRDKVAKALRDAADKIDKGGPVPDFTSYGCEFRKLTDEAPRKPILNTSKIERTIHTLEIAADDAIAISADDYAEYLR